MSKSSYEKIDKSPGVSFSAHRLVFERFEYLVPGSPNLQITQNQYVSTAKGSHEKSKALQVQMVELPQAPQKVYFSAPPPCTCAEPR